jgi:cell wall-associated NlpC family hydrolase
MVSQLLFGEAFGILSYHNNWAQVFALNDPYEGWIDKKLIGEVLPLDEEKLAKIKTDYASKPIQAITLLKNQSTQWIPAGANIPANRTANEFALGSQIFRLSNGFELNNKTNAIHLAKQFENAPYLWGGKSIFGIDCSGLTQLIYNILGFSLPRDASQQVKKGNTIDFLGEAKAGDLAFFDNEEGHIIHVGILINNQQIIHASGTVRIDSIDHQGIFNADTKKYSHKLRIIKRLTR